MHAITARCRAGDLWQADHIVPVSEGGGEADLDNYRTLCDPCHARETAALQVRLSLVSIIIFRSSPSLSV